MRTHCLILLCLLAAPLAAAAQEGRVPAVAVQIEPEDSSPDVSLEALLWVARPIVVFAETPNDPRFVQQMELLEQYPGDLDSRDVLVLTDTDPEAESALRTELRPSDFTLVLIDKDGSVVQRRPTPTSVRELTRTIDRLPSRRQETGSMRQ